MNRFLKSLSISLFMCIIFTQVAFAEIPVFTIVIGDNAFSLEYINDENNKEEIQKLLTDSKNNVYVKNFNGTWIDNKTGKKVNKSSIPAVTYKNKIGEVKKYSKGDGEKVEDKNNSDDILLLNIRASQSGIGQVVNIDLTDEGKEVFSDAVKFQVYDNSNNLISRSQFLGIETYIYPSKNKEEKLMIKLLDNEDNEVAVFENIAVITNNTIKVTYKNLKGSEIINVKNAKELLENIGPNRILELRPGKYDLLDTKILNNKYIEYEQVYDGYQLIIKNVNNLTIRGNNGVKTELLIEPRYANVLTFRECRDINISNVTAGHYPDKGYCTGGVFVFNHSNNININNSVLFGCGIEGINLNHVENFTFTDSVIKECSYGIMSIRNSKNIRFDDSKFYDCREFYLIDVKHTTAVEFDKCKIYNNELGEYSDYIFDVDLYSSVIVKDSEITNNKVKNLVNEKDNVTFENVKFENNTFDTKSKEKKQELVQFQLPQKGEEIAVVTTNKGVIKIKLFPQYAPKSVENFKTHAKNGYYDNLTFHRVINDFMIQGGDPTGTGTGGQSIWKKPFNDEFNPQLHNFRGALSMANAGPNTNGSQFFIVQRDFTNQQFIDSMKKVGEDSYPEAVIEKYEEVGGTPWLDYHHTVFGQVFEGMDIVDSIASVKTDKSDKPVDDVIIKKIEIVEN